MFEERLKIFNMITKKRHKRQSAFILEAVGLFIPRPLSGATLLRNMQTLKSFHKTLPKADLTNNNASKSWPPE